APQPVAQPQAKASAHRAASAKRTAAPAGLLRLLPRRHARLRSRALLTARRADQAFPRHSRNLRLIHSWVRRRRCRSAADGAGERLGMEFIRPVDWDQSQVNLDGGYKGQYLYAGESCLIIATKVPPGVSAPPRHRHPSDQTYIVLQGEMTVELGEETE